MCVLIICSFTYYSQVPTTQQLSINSRADNTAIDETEIRAVPTISSQSDSNLHVIKEKLLLSGGNKPASWSAEEYLGAIQQLFDWDRRLVRFYSNIYRISRFSGRPLEPGLYRDAMKCLVILLKTIG